MNWIGVMAGLVGLAFAGYLAASVLRQPKGTPRVQELSAAIRQGATAFLRREFRTLTLFAVVMFVVVIFLIHPGKITLMAGLAYLLGTITSALAAFIGMSIATRANGRTAHAASTSYATALKIAISSGAVMGFCVVGLGLFGIAIMAVASEDTKVWLSFAFGASSVALFLRVGGGIFTKSADVGADLVGKVEAGIPEDDPRNPAVIADNVGDNVGDIAGMGSDLYESYVSAVAASMVLAHTTTYGAQAVVLPLLLGAVGIGASIIGILSIRPPEVGGSFEEQTHQAHKTMNRAVYLANILTIVGSLVLTWVLLGVLGPFFALVAGLLCGSLIGWVTEYYTGEKAPVIGIAKAAETGAATVIIEGLAVGMVSTVGPVLLVVVATVLAYYFAGLYGIAIASMGMLATLGAVLAMDCYGPIVDNAAGIAEMAELGQHVRERCEALDAVGNTTAAIGKGFAIGSAALAALAWLATYFEVAKLETVDLTDVRVISGLLIGAMLAYLFSALAMRAVGKGAFQVVHEVRRQFKEIPGLMEGTAKPDYVQCVDIATRSALRSMLLPGILVVATPIVIGVVPSLGPEALAGMLTGALLSGFLVAVMMANAGGAWDNAKKYIEAGHLGGKGSPSHKAAVTGDTVGDPFKDTAGPSLNILIKLVGKVAVILAPFFLWLTS
ncbi:MAG: sodium-translocating pyrophosphatase [Candidatus Methylomirabilales bacterium]